MLERIPRACPTEETFLRKKIEAWTRFDLIVGRRRDISIRSVKTFPRALKVATIPLETLDSEHRLVHRAGIHADKPVHLLLRARTWTKNSIYGSRFDAPVPPHPYLSTEYFLETLLPSGPSESFETVQLSFAISKSADSSNLCLYILFLENFSTNLLFFFLFFFSLLPFSRVYTYFSSVSERKRFFPLDFRCEDENEDREFFSSSSSFFVLEETLSIFRN